MNGIESQIRMANKADRSRLANLIHFGSHIHQHLDWKSPLEWVGDVPYLILEEDGGLVASLACPPELPGVTWIRLFAINSSTGINHIWKILWSATIEELTRLGITQVAALSLQSWFNVILEESHFIHTDNVVVLMRENTASLPEPKSTNIVIRPMLPEDLEIVTQLDNSAFNLEWRNSYDSLEIAYHQSAIATIAEVKSEIIGYQYSTIGTMGGHLARLAIKPSYQRNGIGYLLVHDVLSQFIKQHIMHVTVNTQQNNIVSLALYEKAGFKSTGEAYRVYKYILNQ